MHFINDCIYFTAVLETKYVYEYTELCLKTSTINTTIFVIVNRNNIFFTLNQAKFTAYRTIIKNRLFFTALL